MVAGREQQRSEKTADQTKHDHDLRVHRYREEEGGDGDGGHQTERDRERDQVVESVRAESVGVENQDAGRAKTLARDAIIFARSKPAGGNQQSSR